MKETISSLYNIFSQSDGICTDTRSLRANQLFFALKGDNFNGNRYAAQALENGACLAIIDEADYDKGEGYLLVDDVLITLQQLAAHHRALFDIPILAIVGSNGKTTTKELLACAMASDRKLHFTAGNLNNHIGVPLTLLSMSLNTEFAIIEMGANHIGEIAALCDIAKPTHGLITNIGHAHIGEFGGREAIIRAKSELFDYMRKTDGTPFINTEDTILMNMSKRFSNAVSFPNNLCQLKDQFPLLQYEDDQGKLHSTQLTGGYNFLNMSAAITVAKYFGVDDPYALIDQYVSVNNRSQILQIGSNSIVLDAYNANPDSMKVALEALSLSTEPCKVAILGDMKELGEYAQGHHSEVVSQAEQLSIDQILLVGEDFSNAVKSSPKIHAFTNMVALIVYLESNPIANSTVLIKGSRSMKMEQLIKIPSLWH